MRRIIVLAVLVVSLCIHLAITLTVCAGVRNMVWQPADHGISDTDLRIVSVGPARTETVYASSDSTVYKTMDNGATWEEIVSFRSAGTLINAIAVAPEDTQSIYICTGDGLYRNSDGKIRLEKIFSGIGDEEGNVLSIAIDNKGEDFIYIGTEAGLFFTKNRGRNWEKGRNIPSDTGVHFITIDNNDPKIIYSATDGGIYKSLNKGATWERIYGLRFSTENGLDSNEFEVLESDEIRAETRMKNIAIDPENSKTVYAGSSKGLLVSEDSGATWKHAGNPGLISQDIRHLVVDPEDVNTVYAATGRGVFKYSKADESWDELYEGLVSADVRYLTAVSSNLENRNILWAATDRGMFRLMYADDSEGGILGPEEIFMEFSDEPSIEEIREAAIVYAEVHPDKIKKWRKAASHRAWLPDLRVGYGSNKDWQSSTYFYSTSKEKYVDDDITDGKDSGWSVSLTWELGDLIWNNDQTSIDSRSRYAVQLRDDILNAVTRLFFERRRLQIDMIMSPSEDVIKNVEMELRIQELTANIDALTGSFFSSRVEMKKNGNNYIR